MNHGVVPSGVRFLRRGENGYPPQLSDLHDPPEGLFVRGGDLPPKENLVAMVGARSCSPNGADIARSIARGLGEAGIAVVSGAARGIDAASHEGSLQAMAPTVAVLGSGIDVPYPKGSARLLERIAETGIVVSEYPPGVPAMAFRFPARNRIVAALARALIVVEGEDGSGSMISAEHALDLGRDVFAVPGAIMNPLSAVPNALIREGAALIRGHEDVLTELGIEQGDQVEDSRVVLDPDEQRALSAITDRVLPDAIAASLGVSVEEALPLLFRLELLGLIRSVGGRFERRTSGSAARQGS